jgi:pimeloyl-ACP methyl ester carboxylesterase
MGQFLQCGAVRLWAETFGTPGDPCALLLSGAGAHSAFWPTEFCTLLAEKCIFVVRYDHRDIGYSTHTDSPYDIFVLLADAFAVLDALGINAAHFIGHSMGGYLAELAAVHHTSRVLSATIISAGPTVTPGVAAELGLSSMLPQTWEALLANQPAGDFAADLPGWMKSWRLLHGSHPLDEEMAIRYTRELYTRDPRDAGVAERHIAAMQTVPATLAEDLKRLTTRSLALHGSEDPLVPADHGTAVARLIPDCRLQLLPGAGHMFFHRGLWDKMAAAVLTHLHTP